MGFFAGRVTFLRYLVDGSTPKSFGPADLLQLSTRAIGKQQDAAKDGTEAGWIAGEDILDLSFDLAKNIVNDTLHFALRIDTHKLPGDLLRAYTRAELQSLAAGNPSGRPSAKQKKDAREAARERLETEAKDGRFTRRKAYPLLWDRQANQVLIGTTSAGALDHTQRLFQETFGCGLTLLDAGVTAVQRAATDEQMGGLSALRPAAYAVSHGSVEAAWLKDSASLNYLGNDFLMWLWFVLDAEGDVIVLADESELTVMLSRTLSLECPRGESGSETIRSEAPTKLPEARRAIQEGKLPRQTGVILARHDQQYELTFQAETFAVIGAKLPKVEDGEERVKLEDRVGQLRHLIETVDLLYAAFLQRRLGTGWPKEQERMQKWLIRDERARLAATA
jgi:hypothetical protein